MVNPYVVTLRASPHSVLDQLMVAVSDAVEASEIHVQVEEKSELVRR
jgi:hypothetical protein